ncbi:hypothetical protein KA078_01265 [Candidatus Woesebacteria bacterium]|nr:hypothetical protein [Candidatus Woesebacteria bacterium]
MKLYMAVYLLIFAVLLGKTAHTLSTRLANIDDGQQASALRRDITQLSQDKMRLNMYIADAYSLQVIQSGEQAQLFTSISRPVALTQQATLALLQ